MVPLRGIEPLWELTRQILNLLCLASFTTVAYLGSVYTNGFLKVWLGIPASNRNWGSQSPFCYHYNNPQYTNRFIHPTYGNRYGLWGFRRQSWISTSAYTAQRKGGFKLMRYQPHIRCNIAYTPWPPAYCPPHCTSFYLSNITSFVRLIIPLSAYTDTGKSRSL